MISSCSGGGGGGGAGTESISYTGLTNQALITASNVNKIFAVMWYEGVSSTSTSSAPAMLKAVPLESAKDRWIAPFIKRLGEQVSSDVVNFSVMPKNSIRKTPINETYNGLVSGTVTVTGSIDANGTGTLTMTYTNYNDGYGYTEDGTVTVRIDGYDFMYNMITDMTMSFSLLTIKSVNYDISMSGSIREQESVYTNSDIMTVNIVCRDNASRETSRFENYVRAMTYDNFLTPTSAQETYIGRIYVEKYGYVDVSTVSPCIYSHPQPDPDNGGPIILNGAGNTKARITPISTNNVKIEVDDDGDDIFESQNAYSWSNLDGPPVSLIIWGVVTEPTGSSPIPVAGVTVTLRKTDKSVVATTITAGDGLYSFTNIPTLFDVYVNVSKTGYASCNTEIVTDNIWGGQVNIYPESVVKSIADALYGSPGGSSWSDPFYSGTSWFVISVWSIMSQTPMPGVTVSVTPSGPAILYNNGSDIYSPTGPTVSTANMPQTGGYYSSEGVYMFTLTKATHTYTVKLPLVKGELTYGYTALYW